MGHRHEIHAVGALVQAEEELLVLDGLVGRQPGLVGGLQDGLEGVWVGVVGVVGAMHQPKGLLDMLLCD